MTDTEGADTVEIPTPSEEDRHPIPLSSQVVVDLGGLSDQGKVRTNNEDHYLVARCERSLRALFSNLPARDIAQPISEVYYGLLVADGIGGAVGGEIASRMAINALVDLILQTPDWIMQINQELAQQVIERMEERFQQIHDAVKARAAADPTLAGMGTTLTVACSHGRNLLIVHVGDSRAYLCRDGRLLRLTRDQTVAQSLVDAGALRPEEADKHRLRHMLTGGIGVQVRSMQALFNPVQLETGDQLLLCSDGLTEMVSEDDIALTLQRPGTASDICEVLVDQALQAGGKDNVTVVLARYRIPPTDSDGLTIE